MSKITFRKVALSERHNYTKTPPIWAEKIQPTIATRFIPGKAILQFFNYRLPDFFKRLVDIE